MVFNIRKVASILASSVMVTSTVALAMAANFPAPFVKDGKADVAIVYGSSAQNTDLVAATEISSALSAALTAQKATGSTTSADATVSGGDFVELEKSTNKFNLGDTMSGVFGSTVDSDDLEELLADGTYLNDENSEYDYEQKLYLQALQMTHFADSDYKDKEPTVGFSVSSSTLVLNYTLDFTTDAESDVVSGDLADFETTDLKILGKSYYILDAKNGTSSAVFGKFTLLDSATTAIVEEGETSTVTLGDKTYQVSINFVSASSVKLNVDGAITNSLAEGETYKLSDGSYVGIRDILVQDYAGGVKKVEFSIGSGKLEIESGSEIELNDDTVDGIRGHFVRGTPSSGRQKLDKVIIEWTTEDDEFITPGMDLAMPGFGAVKFSMGKFVTPEQEVTKVDYDGDDSIEVSAPVKDGTARFNILKANSSGEFTLIGKDSDERLLTSSNGSITFYERMAGSAYHKWFVATYNTSDDAETYLLSASVSETNSKNRTTIKNEVTGSNLCADKIAGDTCDIGDVSLTIVGVDKNSTDKWVTFSAGSNVNFNTLFTKEGLKMYLPYEAANGTTNYGAVNFSQGAEVATTRGNLDKVYLYFAEENKDDDKGAGSMFNLTINDDSDGDLSVSAVTTGYTNHEILGTSDDTVSRVQSDLATEVKRLVSTDKGRAEIVYSGSEAYAQVFLTDTSANVGSGSSELGSVTMVDSELSSVSGKNLVVVGGSCVNSVAASLLGVTYPACGASWESATGVGAGSFLIQSFDNGSGKVATLVAGYNAGDTTNAAKALTTQVVDTSAGKKYTGSTATSVSLVL